jgi:hypothetical protein
MTLVHLRLRTNRADWKNTACRVTKDKMSWSRGRLDQLVQDLEIIVGKESKAHITGLKDLSGEVRPLWKFYLSYDRGVVLMCWVRAKLLDPWTTYLPSSGMDLLNSLEFYGRHMSPLGKGIRKLQSMTWKSR